MLPERHKVSLTWTGSRFLAAAASCTRLFTSCKLAAEIARNWPSFANPAHATFSHQARLTPLVVPKLVRLVPPDLFMSHASQYDEPFRPRVPSCLRAYYVSVPSHAMSSDN